MTLQRRIRAEQRVRQESRSIEFDAWYADCGPRRHALTAINYTFLAVLGAFTFVVCLLVSAAFTDEECALWVLSVVENIVVQIFVTDFLIGGGLLVLRLAGSSILLRMDRRARAKARALQLRQREENLKDSRDAIEHQMRKVRVPVRAG